MYKILLLTVYAFALLILPQCTEKRSVDFVQEGIGYTNREDYEKAIESFLLAIEKDPKNAKAWFALGGIYNFKKQYEKALEAFKSAINLDPAYHDAYYSLGYTYEILGKKDESEEAFRKQKDLKARLDAYVKKEEASR
jgi:Tfp pilus assembly protein PilF